MALVAANESAGGIVEFLPESIINSWSMWFVDEWFDLYKIINIFVARSINPTWARTKCW